jgi:hypothetical protein
MHKYTRPVLSFSQSVNYIKLFMKTIRVTHWVKITNEYITGEGK